SFESLPHQIYILLPPSTFELRELNPNNLVSLSPSARVCRSSLFGEDYQKLIKDEMGFIDDKEFDKEFAILN
ncbi:hypothetical protein C5167_008903, partial [Papaver somniferum]